MIPAMKIRIGVIGESRAGEKASRDAYEVGRLIARTEDYISAPEAGDAIVDLGYGHRDNEMGTAVFTSDAQWRKAALARARQRERAFLGFLRRAGMGELSGR